MCGWGMGTEWTVVVDWGSGGRGRSGRMASETDAERAGPGDAGDGAGGERAELRLMGLTRHVNGNYTHPEDPGEPGLGTPRVSVTDEECKVLGWLAADRTVLEIGTGLGVSTRAMQAAGGEVETVDVDPWVQANVWPGLRELGVECRDVADASPYAAQFDMCFIDGAHDEASVERDLDTAMRLVRPGGLIVLHDTNYEGVWKPAKKRGNLVRMDSVGWIGLLFVPEAEG